MSALPDPERWRQLDTWLQEALDLDPPARDAWLRALAQRDPDAATTVSRLLAAEDAQDDPTGTIAAAIAALDGGAPERIGEWRVLRPLGHGGMADVWLAERDAGGFVQRAALKRLAPGMATPELVARFAQERQILAALDDPGIARLIDGGVDERGLPWLALEYVEGRDIATWCDARRAGVGERVALLARVAAVVARAHRRLVVHRDLKPENVLVADDGSVRLLDFGIAKLLDPDALPHAAPPTRVGTRALTVAYASPEQLRGEPVTVASDVYQLGLLGHVLLTGQQPFQGPGITSTERERRILEWTPDAPSSVARRDDTAGTAPDRAAARGATPAALARALRGDLDVIVQRAMAKQPGDRYPTADALREDLERHLAHRPILARPPAVLYRIGRWLRRNARIAVPAALALAFGVTYLVSTVQHARRLEREIAISRAVRDYVLSMFQVADPGLANGRPTTGEEMLDRGAREAMSQLSSQPSVQTEILSLLAQVRLARWEPAKALPLAERALEVQRTVVDGEPASLEEATFALGLAYFYVSRHAEAEALVRESLALRERRLGPDDAGTHNAHLLLTAVLHHRGEIEAARASGLRLVEIAGRDPVANAGTLAYGWHELADIERDAGHFPQALAYYERVVSTGDVSPMTEGDFGRCLLQVGRLGEARERIERGLAIDEKKFGPAHMFSAIHRRNRALLAQAEGRPLDAIADLQGSLAVYDRRVGLTSSYAAQIRADLGFALLAQGRHAEAAQALAIARDVLRGTRDGGHPVLGAVEAGLGLAQWQAGDVAKAREHLDAALALRRRDFGAGHPYTRVIEEAIATVAGSPVARAPSEADAWFEVRRVRAALEARPTEG